MGFLSPTQCMKVKMSLPGICSWSFPEYPPRSVQRRTASSVRSPNIPAWPRRREHSAVRSAAGRRSFAAPGKNARRNQNKLRQAMLTGGVSVRMCDEPMIYLDKNYVAIFGGVQKALIAVAGINDRKKSFRSKAAMKTATSSGKLLLPFTPAQTLFMWTVEN